MNILSFKDCRISRNLTQEQLAFQAGISVKTIYNIENRNNTDVKTALKIAKILNYFVEEMFE